MRPGRDARTYGRWMTRIDISVDKWSHSLVIYSYPEMTFLRTIGGQGGAPGKFNSPQGLDVDDETGNIFVADTGNDRVQVRGPRLPTRWSVPFMILLLPHRF